MKRKEDIDAYIKKNALKKTDSEKEKERQKKEDDEPELPPAGKTAMDYGLMGISGYVVLVLMFIGFGIIVVNYWLDRVFQEPLRERIIVAVIFFVLVAAVASAGYYLKFRTYLNWINNKHYALEGWDKLISDRTPNFWKGSYFVHISISVLLNDKATQSERDAVGLFMKKWEEGWDMQYARTNYKHGKPDDFTARGPRLSGDFSKKRLDEIVNNMGTRFLSLARLLGDSLHKVQITASGKEKHYIVIRDKDDVYDTASSWNSRHGG